MARTNVRWWRVVVLSALLAAALSSVASRAGSEPAQPRSQVRPAASRTYVVHPGDTLWRLASSLVGPGADPRPMVDRLARLNAIQDGVIVPGQRLALP